MSNATSCPIHPEHELRLMEPRDPFNCTKCKEIGFGAGYGCPGFVVRFHKECVSPSPARIQKLQWKKLSLKYDPDMNADNGKPRFCFVCAKPVRGCGYRSSSEKNCHPSCLALPRSIMVNGVELNLAYKMKSNCKWCSNMKIYHDKVKLRSWSYAGRKAEYHVGCVKDMVIESWRNGEFVPAREGDAAGPMHIKVDLSSRGTSEIYARLGAIAMRASMAAVTGDPTALFT